jgi:hypothetical protein
MTMPGLESSAPGPRGDDGRSAVGQRLRALGRALGRVGLSAWFIAMVAVCGTLLGRHLIALPRPANDAALAQAMSSLRGSDGAGRWMTVHVLYADCPCSKLVAEHVLAGGRPGGVIERVLLIGRDADLEAKFGAMGLPVTTVSEDEAATRFHVVAAPTLVVVAPDGTVRYAGGYTARKQGPSPQDLTILASARAGRDVAPLPIFGCAVSARLRHSLNPLGLP